MTSSWRVKFGSSAAWSGGTARRRSKASEARRCMASPSNRGETPGVDCWEFDTRRVMIFHPTACQLKPQSQRLFPPMHRLFAVALIVMGAVAARADGPMDNLPDKVRRIPPPGAAIPDADRVELLGGVEALAREIEGLKVLLKGKPALLDL